MTYEEAIKMLENSACSIAMEEAVDVAIEALEKQIPKKFERILGSYFCPKCGCGYGARANYIKHCFYCGQAILWEDTE